MKIKNKIRFRCITVVLALLVVAPVITSGLNAQSTGQVIGFEDGMVRINWGTNDGLIQGILLNVFQEVPTIHPVTRERFGTAESIVAQLEAAECFPGYSLAKVLSSTAQIKVGDIIRISFDTPDLETGEGDVEKGTIVNITNQLVKFNLGRRDGVEENLIFDIIRMLGASRHPVTGERIEPRNIYIGKATVVKVNEDDAIAQIITQERDVLIGDRVLLSAQQAGDLEMFPTETELPVTEQQVMDVAGQPEITAQPEAVSGMALPEKVVGTVTRIQDKDVFFIWRGEYDFPAGKVLGIYRQEQIVHPETKIEIDTQLFLIGKINLIESIGVLGRGLLVSSDADILPGDYIGVSEGETIVSGQVVDPEFSGDVYQSQRSDILALAQELTEDIQQVQGEMAIVRTALMRLDRIDRELADQKVVTNAINNTLDEIKMLLRGEGYPIESVDLVPTRASYEMIDAPGSEQNTLRIRYTDDVNVKLEMIDKTVFVSLETDTATGVVSLPEREERRPVVIDTTTRTRDSLKTATTETVDDEAGGAFYTQMWFVLTMIVVLIGVAGALFFLLVLKKKKAGSAAADEDEEEAGDEEEGDEDSIEDEDEIIPDEEEIESFEDDEEG
ncbi:hypothetical protein ACFL6L_04045 [candidate division KSB1 bacterium]